MSIEQTFGRLSSAVITAASPFGGEMEKPSLVEALSVPDQAIVWQFQPKTQKQNLAEISVGQTITQTSETQEQEKPVIFSIPGYKGEFYNDLPGAGFQSEVVMVPVSRREDFDFDTKLLRHKMVALNFSYFKTTVDGKAIQLTVPGDHIIYVHNIRHVVNVDRPNNPYKGRLSLSLSDMEIGDVVEYNEKSYRVIDKTKVEREKRKTTFIDVMLKHREYLGKRMFISACKDVDSPNINTSLLDGDGVYAVEITDEENQNWLPFNENPFNWTKKNTTKVVKT